MFMEKSNDKMTAVQLADAMGITARSVNNMANAGLIPFETVNERGDRRFSLPEIMSSDGLPDKHRKSLEVWHKQKLQEPSPTASESPVETSESLPLVTGDNRPAAIDDLLNIHDSVGTHNAWSNLPASCQDKGFKNFQIVQEARSIKGTVKRGKGRKKALAKLAVKNGVRYQTLYRWMQKSDAALGAAKEAGESDLVSPQIRALAPKYGNNRNHFRSWSSKALRFAASLYLRQGCPNITDVYKEVAATADLKNWKVGTYESLVSFIGRIDKTTVSLARLGKKKTAASCITKILRDYEEIPPNFMWCGDHHIFDVFVKVQSQGGGHTTMRPWVTAWMDMRSRSFMGWVISFKPNSQTIAMALAHGISPKNDPNFQQCGLPKSVYIDNGKDYRAKSLNGEVVDIGKIDYPEIIEKYASLGIDPFYIDLDFDPQDGFWKKKRGRKEIVVGGVRVGGVYGALGIGRHYATAYHPWAKPIERAFRNVVQSFSRDLPGWCGSTTDQRPEKLAAELKTGNLLTFDEFTEKFYDYITNIYHKTPHRGHGMNNRTPDEVFQSLLPQPVAVSPEMLDFALAKKERVKIHNWGFALNGRNFQLDIPSNLYGGHLSNHLIGDWARICYDYDFKIVRVYKNGRFVCNAKPLERASFVDPDCPVMLEKIKLQANQKKAASAILKSIHGGADADRPVSESQALLEITKGTFPSRLEFIGSNAKVQSIPDDDYVPIEPSERYQLIIDKLDGGIELTSSDREFKDNFEKSEEFLSYQHLFTGSMDNYTEKGAASWM